MDGTPRRILTVSELTSLVRSCLESGFPDVWFEGEVSNLRAPSSGHLYFTLKDQMAQIRAVLFRAGSQRLRFALKEGQCVIVRGRVSVYEPRGEYQVILDYLEPKGIGALQLAFDQLKERLSKEGLFDPARKRPLPLLPQRVGIVTSLSGAAIRDMLTVLRRRCPGLGVLICPVPVQGDGAASKIADAIRALSVSGEVDVMIVGRGGGSLEDLWCFNEEVVVRAIVASAIPVVSAVGHEIDFTLADFAADYRAPTPSAAAEAVAPVLDDLIKTIRNLWARQERALQGRVTLIQQQVWNHCRSLPVFMIQIRRRMQRVDEAMGSLPTLVKDALAGQRDRTMRLRHDLHVGSPLVRVGNALVLIPQLLKRLEQRMLGALAAHRQTIRSVAGAMEGLSPLAILARGYSILQTEPDGRIVKRVRDVRPGDKVRARLTDGHVTCDIRDILPESQ